MSENGLAVTITATRADGTTEQVRVGTAIKDGDGFRLVLGELQIGGAPAASYTTARRAAPAQASFGGGGGGGGTGDEPSVFPNYGRSKGAPIRGASQGDLDYYANGARRSLSDPSKARFHDKERALLAAIEAEVARQGGGGGSGGSGGGGSGGGGYGGGEPPPPSDEDAPF